MAIFTKVELEAKTNSDLREMCANLGMTGVSKKTKEWLVATLLEAQAAASGNTREALMEKTNTDLREIATGMGMASVSKKNKEWLVNAILGGGSAAVAAPVAPKAVAAPVAQEATAPKAVVMPALAAVSYHSAAILTKPGAKDGDKTTTTIRVACGASSGAFPVSGRKVGEVAEFLREVLNVDRMAQGVVNGKPAEDSYSLKDGDNLEFIKPAGRKG